MRFSSRIKEYNTNRVYFIVISALFILVLWSFILVQQESKNELNFIVKLKKESNELKEKFFGVLLSPKLTTAFTNSDPVATSKKNTIKYLSDNELKNFNITNLFVMAKSNQNDFQKYTYDTNDEENSYRKEKIKNVTNCIMYLIFTNYILVRILF
jgi:hypothetical protein